MRAAFRARSSLPLPGDRLLLVVLVHVLLRLAVAGRGADSRARHAGGDAAEAVEAHAAFSRGHRAAVRRGAARLLTPGPRGRGSSGRTRCHGRLRQVGRPPRRRGPERDPRGEGPGDERRPPVRPPEPRAPGAAVPAAGVTRPRAAQALLAGRGDHLPAHVLRQTKREPLQVAVEARGEGVARRVRPRDGHGRRCRPPRPGPQRAALAPDPLQLHRLLPALPVLLLLLLLFLGTMVAHVDGHLIPLLLRLPRRRRLTGAGGRLSRGGLRLGVEVAPADGARDVAGEPLPDAVRVEGVAAAGQQAELLVVLELAEADRALERDVLAAADPELLRVGVPHRRERRDHGGVEPALLLLLLLVPVPLLLPRQGEQRGGRDPGPRGGAPPAPPHVHGEEADEEEGRDERHQQHDHGSAEAGRLARHALSSSADGAATVVLVPRRALLLRGGGGVEQQQQ